MKFRVALLTTLLFHSLPASAQRTGMVVGVVVDSLHGSWLRGAEISLSGTSDVALTDSVGRFHFDNVPPGLKQIGVFHPLLDSLGISVGSKPFSLGLDSAALIALAVPSAMSLVRELCGVRPPDKVTGLLMGRITDPESGIPVTRSRVAARWMTYEVKGKTNLQEIPQAVVSETDDTGLFRLCGIPIDRAVRMEAFRDTVRSPDLRIVIGGVPIVMIDIAIRSQDSKSIGRIVGRAVDSAGKGLDGTVVEVERLGISATADWNGEFAFDGVPPGTQVLTLRKLGFTPISVPIFVSLNAPTMISYEMEHAVPILQKVSIVEKANTGLTRVGFRDRQKTSLGHFMTADQIDREKTTRLSELLRKLPGLALDESKGSGYVKATRESKSAADRGCIRMIVDGSEWNMLNEGYVDDAIEPSKVGAIEVYHPLDVPPEYSIVMRNCTTIILWSKTRLRAR